MKFWGIANHALLFLLPSRLVAVRLGHRRTARLQARSKHSGKSGKVLSTFPTCLASEDGNEDPGKASNSVGKMNISVSTDRGPGFLILGLSFIYISLKIPRVTPRHVQFCMVLSTRNVTIASPLVECVLSLGRGGRVTSADQP